VLKMGSWVNVESLWCSWGYAENHSNDGYRIWNPASCKVMELHTIIWLHHTDYQDDITTDMAMLLEVCMAVHEISKDTIAALKLEGIRK